MLLFFLLISIIFQFSDQSWIPCTTKNTAISPNFLVWKFCERHSFRIVSGESPKTMRELCLSTKSPHQEIRWNYVIFCSDATEVWWNCASADALNCLFYTFFSRNLEKCCSGRFSMISTELFKLVTIGYCLWKILASFALTKLLIFYLS